MCMLFGLPSVTDTVHNVFHACYLRNCKDDQRKEPPPIPELDEETGKLMLCWTMDAAGAKQVRNNTGTGQLWQNIHMLLSVLPSK